MVDVGQEGKTGELAGRALVSKVTMPAASAVELSAEQGTLDTLTLTRLKLYSLTA